MRRTEPRRVAAPVAFLTMLSSITSRICALRRHRAAHVAVIVLRMVLGFAFLPAGCKKLLGQRFTDVANSGVFHDFLHAFYDTGPFYRFVGAVQLIAAILMITQRQALLGAVLMTPILVAILVFCWSTMVVPTAVVVTLMTCALGVLLLWDLKRWKAIVVATQGSETETDEPISSASLARWSRCGWAIVALYFGNLLLTQEVYRPRGLEWSNPSFYVLLVIAALPVLTWLRD